MVRPHWPGMRRRRRRPGCLPGIWLGGEAAGGRNGLGVNPWSLGVAYVQLNTGAEHGEAMVGDSHKGTPRSSGNF